MMDYSAFYPSILLMYLGTFLWAIVAMTLLLCGAVVLLRQYLKSKSLIELAGVAACMVAVIAIAYFSRSFFQDIPNAVSRNYVIATGTAEGWDTAGQGTETRGFAFANDNGETKKIVVTYTPIYQGDRFEAMYLPNTGYGAIIKKLDGNNVMLLPVQPFLSHTLQVFFPCFFEGYLTRIIRWYRPKLASR